MNFTWDTISIKQFEDASEFTGYHEKLSKIVATYLTGNDNVCDVGCGLGLLDLSLAKYVNRITCVDVSELAIASLKINISKKEIMNIDTQISSWDEITDNYDTIIMSLFGTGLFENLLSLCRKMLLITKSDEDKGMTGLPRKETSHRKRTARDVKEKLEKLGLTYNFEELELEFGQPFHERHEAFEYIKRQYECTDEKAESILNEMLENTGSRVFPFYLPNLKKMTLFEITGSFKESSRY